jgi:signal transduction histidine kinase
MLRSFLTTIYDGGHHLRQHRELWFALVLGTVLPLLLITLTHVVLTTTRTNLATLEKQAVGSVSDVLAVQLQQDVATATMQALIMSLRANNEELREVAVYSIDGNISTPLLMVSDALAPTDYTADYVFPLAIGQIDENFIGNYITPTGGRVVRTYRAVSHNRATYLVATTHDFSRLDSLMGERYWLVYFTLLLTLLFIAFFAYWTARQIDYKARLQKVENRLVEADLLASGMVHELRAPLTGLRGYASLIEENKQVPTEARTHASYIVESAGRLVALISDFLTVTSLRSQAPPARELVDLATVLQKVVTELLPSAHAKHLTLSAPSAVADATLLSVEKYLRQIFTNLVSNAIKYTPSGHIDTTLTNDKRELEVRIKDTGLGISAEDQRRLFAPFTRVGGTESKAVTGTGLGMWITKLMVEELGGSIGVESIKGVGTHVVVRFKKD